MALVYLNLHSIYENFDDKYAHSKYKVFSVKTYLIDMSTHPWVTNQAIMFGCILFVATINKPSLRNHIVLWLSIAIGCARSKEVWSEWCTIFTDKPCQPHLPHAACPFNAHYQLHVIMQLIRTPLIVRQALNSLRDKLLPSR